MNNIKELIAVLSSCAGLLAAVTGFLIPLIKNVKAKNRLSALNKLSAVLQSLIVEAEQFANFSGEEKKAYVLTKASRYAMNNGIIFDEQKAAAELENIVELSKKVNAPQAAPEPCENAQSFGKYKIGG